MLDIEYPNNAFVFTSLKALFWLISMFYIEHTNDLHMKPPSLDELKQYVECKA